MPTLITLSHEHLRALRNHLFIGQDEQAAFGFAEWDPSGAFRITAIDLVSPEGFAFQSDYHIELSSETQARIIKRAFDLTACLVEFHSHRSHVPARFSGSDFRGFEEFVPHVRWRLGDRPYAAAVFHQSSYDGLVWIHDKPVQLDTIQVLNGETQMATRLSLRDVEEVYDR
jgi:hypothetical protein